MIQLAELPMRACRCACGGQVVCYGLDDAAVQAAQRRHNSSMRHREWRLITGRSSDLRLLTPATVVS